MADQDLINQLLNIAAECTSTPIDELVVDARWGTLNFEKCREDLDRLFYMLRALKDLPLDLLPSSTAASAIEVLNDVKSAIDQVKSFSIEVENAQQDRDNRASTVISHIHALDNVLVLWIPFLSLQSGDAQKVVDRLNQTLMEARSAYESAIVEAQAKKNEAEEVVSAIRDAAGKEGVAQYTKDFDTEAGENGSIAFRWLIGTGIFAGLTVLAAALLLKIPVGATTVLIIQATTTKLVILGLLFTATLWCGRMFKASKHQQSINKHRANALKAFQTFVQASNDPSIRDAVLMETTRSIFTITPSGYLNEGGQSVDGGTKIIETIKSVTERPGRSSE